MPTDRNILFQVLGNLNRTKNLVSLRDFYRVSEFASVPVHRYPEVCQNSRFPRLELAHARNHLLAVFPEYSTFPGQLNGRVHGRQASSRVASLELENHG